MPSIDPITGLPDGDDSSQETQSSFALRPQSPLVRGTHLDKSVDRIRKFPKSTLPIDANLQQPAKRGELCGLIPLPHSVLHPRDRLQHVFDVVQCVIEGKEEFIRDEDLLSSQPLNLEKTRFTMSKKKLKLQFIDDILDRVENDRWLNQETFEKKRKQWHKSVARSLKCINKFLDNEQARADSTMGDQSLAKPPGEASSSAKKRGRKSKDKAAPNEASKSIVKAAGKKETPAKRVALTASKKEKTAQAPPSSEKDKDMRGRGNTKTQSQKPTFGRKKKEADLPEAGSEVKTKRKSKQLPAENEESEQPSLKKMRKEKKAAEGEPGGTNSCNNDAPKTKKPAFGAPKRGKRGQKGEEKADESNPATLPTSQSKDAQIFPADSASVEVRADEKMDTGENKGGEERAEETEKRREETARKRGRNDEDERVKEREKEMKLEVYDRIEEDDEAEVGTMRSQKLCSQPLVIPSGRGEDDMETDDEEWEPNETPRDITLPRGLLPISHDPCLPPSTPSIMSVSSQSLFSGSLNSSMMCSPNTSFSSQSSVSLLAPSMMPSFNLSSSLLPSQSLTPLATSTQIPHQSSSSAEKKEKETIKEKKEAESSGPRVRPTFGKRK